MRLASGRFHRTGERTDDPAIVHDVNVLTVIANESYKDFVAGLQKDISESLSERPRFADEAYFTGKTIVTEAGAIQVTPQMAQQIYRYLVKNDYTGEGDRIATQYHPCCFGRQIRRQNHPSRSSLRLIWQATRKKSLGVTEECS